VLPGATLSGVHNLDKLLGGGLDKGTSTLVIGPAGTGKSTIVTTYAIAAAERGERAALFLFDENIGTLLARCEALDMPLARHIQRETITVQQIDPAEMSPGELIQTVRDCVDQDVKVVVFDSLIGLLNAMPEEKMLLTQLHELLSYLNQRSVTTLMTMVQHGLLGNMSTPADLSYLADTLLLLRYFEAEGQVRQALSVMKKRTAKHERSIREVRVAPGGVEVGQPLVQFQGVLTGVPRYVGRDASLMERQREDDNA
jgi:circadian clock protein KaiC